MSKYILLDTVVAYEHKDAPKIRMTLDDPERALDSVATTRPILGHAVNMALLYMLYSTVLGVYHPPVPRTMPHGWTMTPPLPRKMMCEHRNLSIVRVVICRCFNSLTRCPKVLGKFKGDWVATVSEILNAVKPPTPDDGAVTGSDLLLHVLDEQAGRIKREHALFNIGSLAIHLHYQTADVCPCLPSPLSC